MCVLTQMSVSVEVVAVAWLEPEGAGNWFLAVVLALTLLRLSLFVCLFFQFSTEPFCFCEPFTEVMRCEPLRMCSFYVRATSVAPGAERDISCLVEIFVPLLSCPCLKKGYRIMPASSTETPEGQAAFRPPPQSPSTVICGHGCSAFCACLSGFSSVAFDFVNRAT